MYKEHIMSGSCIFRRLFNVNYSLKCLPFISLLRLLQIINEICFLFDLQVAAKLTPKVPTSKPTNVSTPGRSPTNAISRPAAGDSPARTSWPGTYASTQAPSLSDARSVIAALLALITSPCTWSVTNQRANPVFEISSGKTKTNKQRKELSRITLTDGSTRVFAWWRPFA